MYSLPHITIEGTNLNAVEHFTYLGSIVSKDATIRPAVPLEDCERVWHSNLLRLPTLLYGAETWVLYRKQIRLLKWFYQHCLCFILGIKWQHYMSNEEILKKANLPSIESILLQVQLPWVGHITRMKGVRMPKAVFFSKLQEGKHNLSAPRKHYKDQLKRQLEQAAINHQSWQQKT